ncbi:MAG: hypothetical protein U1E26_06725 [Coriobacteriia bacterium]|nr:hypothetical protein [Coriobacteriia bacterium]
MKNRVSYLLLAVSILAVSASLVGCGNKAPQLTAEQLQAGVIGSPHPVNQQDAMAQGCSCHTNQ